MEHPNCPRCGLPFFPEWTNGDRSKPYCQGGKTGGCFPRTQHRAIAGGWPTINTEPHLTSLIAGYLMSKEPFIEDEHGQ